MTVHSVVCCYVNKGKSQMGESVRTAETPKAIQSWSGLHHQIFQDLVSRHLRSHAGIQQFKKPNRASSVGARQGRPATSAAEGPVGAESAALRAAALRGPGALGRGRNGETGLFLWASFDSGVFCRDDLLQGYPSYVFCPSNIPTYLSWCVEFFLCPFFLRTISF